RQLHDKNSIKRNAYLQTELGFGLLKTEAQQFVESFHQSQPESPIEVRFQSKQEKCFSLQFGSDVLFFMLHSNTFEFNRDHEVMKLPYIREDKNRSFCGLINIYNFLTDSVVYNRYNDAGYLIGRVFVNAENHYYIDGKKEVGQIYNNFANNIIDEQAVHTILEAAIQYSIGFDLLVPPYDLVKEITVMDMVEIDNMHAPIQTSKRLGFRFQADM
ncbi:MAG: hypothetical protein J5792_07580, partial [Bacteroidales bacterium]|nr:hypothetical protein [Bacteroidales bacterium]